MIFAAVVPGIDSFNYFYTLLMTPMFLFSGIFFPILLIANSRLIVLSLLGLYLLMMSIGLALETAAGSYFAGSEPLAVVVEVAVMTVWITIGGLLVSRHPGHPVE